MAIRGVSTCVAALVFACISSGMGAATTAAGLGGFSESPNSAAAHEHQVHASLPRPDAIDWLARTDAAYRNLDYNAAIAALTQLARSRPEDLGKVDEWVIVTIVGKASQQPPPFDHWFDLLSALRDANWNPSSDLEPSRMWRDLARMLIQKTQIDPAVEVASKVTNPYVLISMKADDRYDALIKRDPSHYEIDQAVVNEASHALDAVTRAPRSLAALSQLNDTLLSIQKYDRVLSLSDDALNRAAAADPDHPAYDDARTKLIQIRDDRAWALLYLGRRDEAIDEWISATHELGEAGASFSVAIHLGLVYCALDRPRDAQLTVSELKQPSPAQQMQIEGVRLAAGVELGDVHGVQDALAYLHSHSVEAPAAYQEALVRAGRLDEASAYLISRLTNAHERGDALLDVQQFKERPVPLRAHQWQAAWDVVLRRPAVQAAIAKLGRTESYVLAPMQ